MDEINALSSFDGVKMPFSLEAEQAVLGSLLIDPGCMPQVLMLVKGEYFYLPQHQAIFGIMVNIDAMGGKIDPLLVLDQLKKDNVYDDAGGKTYLFQLAQAVPSTANVEAYARIVREKFYMRTLINVSREIIDSATTEEAEADLLLDAAEQRIYDIRQGKNTVGPSRLSDVIVNEVYDRLYKLSSPDREQYMGFTTGFSDLDRVISGLNKSDLIIVGARPAMGKTSFALNIARNVALKAKKKVLFFSLEMTKEQLAQRLLSSEARVGSQKMRTGQLTDDEWSRLGAATVVLNECDLYVDDTSSITVPEMKARVRRMRDVDCVVIDYLQLMQSGKRTENRVQEVSDITRNLKLMAKDVNVPVITLAQLARGTEGRGKSHRPQLSDLRESGSIEQDADQVLFLYRDEYYKNEKEDPGEVESNTSEVIVAKNRHGELGTVKLAWFGEFTQFTSLEMHQSER